MTHIWIHRVPSNETDPSAYPDHVEASTIVFVGTARVSFGPIRADFVRWENVTRYRLAQIERIHA